PGGARFRDDFHIFAVEWQPGRIDYYVDDVLYLTVREDELAANQRWAFSGPMFIIFDLAVGGAFVGPVDDSVLPQPMVIDWVRGWKAPSGGGLRAWPAWGSRAAAGPRARSARACSWSRRSSRRRGCAPSIRSCRRASRAGPRAAASTSRS